MAFGLGRLRLSPRDFWNMTPRELSSALVALAAPRAAPPRKGDLARLMEIFPDKGTRT